MKCHKLAIITRMDRDFMQDVKFNMEKYLVKHFARRFGKAEEAAFVSGTGVDMPTGILHETDGAEVGYLAHEYLDAKLIRPEAIKVLQLS